MPRDHQIRLERDNSLQIKIGRITDILNRSGSIGVVAITADAYQFAPCSGCEYQFSDVRRKGDDTLCKMVQADTASAIIGKLDRKSRRSCAGYVGNASSANRSPQQ